MLALGQPDTKPADKFRPEFELHPNRWKIGAQMTRYQSSPLKALLRSPLEALDFSQLKDRPVSYDLHLSILDQKHL